MRVRIALTLLFALAVFLATGPVYGGEPDPEIGPGSIVAVAHPRAAVLTVFHSAAESFLLPRATTKEEPIPVAPKGSVVHLAADYEAVFMPLTAGWTRFHLAAYRITGSGQELLGFDRAEVVKFGPARRGGRLMLKVELKPGLHQLRLVAETSAKAVGVSDWTDDRDEVTLWVLVPPTAVQPAPAIEAAPSYQPAAAIAPAEGAVVHQASLQVDSAQTQTEWTATASSIPETGVDPSPLPLGGLSVGAQRGIAGTEAVGALNFETGHNRTLVVRTGQPVHVWSDYEVWLSEGARAEADVSLAVRRRPTDSSAELAPLATDAYEMHRAVGPLRKDGSLKVGFSFSQPGTYHLLAVLDVRVHGIAAAGSTSPMASEDHDVVPFTVKVVGVPPVTGAIAGVVHGADGMALQGVEVDATDKNGRVVGAARTNANGFYKIDQLKPGEYRVHAVPGELNYLHSWWDDKPTVRHADPVKVVAGRVTDGINFKLTPGGTITGRVVNEAGEGLGGIDVVVGWLRTESEPANPVAPGIVPKDPTVPEEVNKVLGRTKTNDDGFYSIDKLPAGMYWVRASDPEGRYLTEYFDDKPNFGQADKVPVKAGGVTDEINFMLAPGGAITGHVREETVLAVIIPLPGMMVEARSAEHPDYVIGRTTTDREGGYKIGNLREGAYLVRASDPNGVYLAEWYEEVDGPGDATPVKVESGHVADGINFTLSKPEPKTRVFVNPPRTGVRKGGSGQVSVSVAHVENLGAFEVELAWNPDIVQVDEVELGAFLGSTGRRVVPIAPVIDNDAGHLRFAAASIGDQPGPNGGGVLFEVKFTGLNIGTTGLEIDASTLTLPGGRPIEHVRSHGRILVGECMLGDFDCNCVIDIRDVMAVVSRWGTSEGDPDYDAQYDLNNDGHIDIVDVQIVAGLWGKTCEEPPDANVEPGSQGEATTDSGSAELPYLPEAPLGASLDLTAMPNEASIGDTVVVTVGVDEAGDVAGFEFSVDYDAERLRFVSAELGEFLGGTGRTVLPVGPQVGEGLVKYGALSLPGHPAASGSGTLAALTFEVVASGDALLQVTDAMLVDSLDNATVAGGGTVTVQVGGGAGVAAAMVPFAARGR